MIWFDIWSITQCAKCQRAWWLMLNSILFLYVPHHQWKEVIIGFVLGLFVTYRQCDSVIVDRFSKMTYFINYQKTHYKTLNAILMLLNSFLWILCISTECLRSLYSIKTRSSWAIYEGAYRKGWTYLFNLAQHITLRRMVRLSPLKRALKIYWEVLLETVWSSWT